MKEDTGPDDTCKWRIWLSKARSLWFTVSAQTSLGPWSSGQGKSSTFANQHSFRPFITIFRLENTTGIVTACVPTLQPLYHIFSSEENYKLYCQKRQEWKDSLQGAIGGCSQTHAGENDPQHRKPELDAFETARSELGDTEPAELDCVDTSRYFRVELPTNSNEVPRQESSNHTGSEVMEAPAD